MKYFEVQELPMWPSSLPYPVGFWKIAGSTTSICYTDPSNPGHYTALPVTFNGLLRGATGNNGADVDVNKLVDQIVALCAKERV